MLKRILSFFKTERIYIILAAVSAAIASVLQLSLPYLMGSVIDFIHGKGNVQFNLIFKYTLIMAFAVIFAALFNWITKILSNKIAFKIGCSVRKEYMKKVNQMPISFFDKTPHGDMASRITNDIETITEGIQQSTSQLFIGISTLLGTLVLMLSLNWVITLIVVFLTPFAFLLSSFIVKNIDKTFKLQQKTVGEINAFAKEHIDAQKTIKAYSFEKASEKQFNEINKRLYACGQKAQFFSSLVNPTTRLINSSTYIIVGIVCGLFVVANKKIGGQVMSIGLSAAFLSYALQFAQPINNITNVTSQIEASYASFGRIFEILDLPCEPCESENAARLKVDKGSIEFENVNFSYDNNKPVIKNVSLEIKEGSKVAVVGPTGAGKTTLVNLLMRFYDAQSGKILIDGQDTSKVSRNSLRTSFAMVLQETFLFEDTVKNNIAYGKPDAADAEIMAAAKEAYAHNFIKRLPNGYDTVISAGADELSAGQKQLLTIARAMLVNPPMLILDEATSSVDTLTEIRIQKAFEKMMQGKTTFVIAHRLSTIIDSDLILVMDKGNIVEVGTHEQLLKSGGLYSVLYNSQFEK